MLPFKLTPAYTDYLWGGNLLKTEYGKKTDMEIVAESWELSAHEDGSSIIATGEFEGTSFADFAKKHPEALGTNCEGKDRFPLLIKLIDAQQALSIQVHPDDEYGYEKEGEPGKTEMWIVLEHKPDAFIYFGFENEITKDEFKQRIEKSTLDNVLKKVPVKKGDVFFIPAGTIHAIGAGIVIAEVQENSNTTYRVSDFGRLGADGKPRELHIAQSLEVTSLVPASFSAPGLLEPEAIQGGTIQQLAKCPWFTVSRLNLNGGKHSAAANGESFVSVLCTNGGGSISCGGTALPMQKGESAFIPALAGGYSIEGSGEFILSSI